MAQVRPALIAFGKLIGFVDASGEVRSPGSRDR